MAQITEKIAVLLGGPSSEREISIKSGTAVYEALTSYGLDAVCIDVSDNPVKQIREQSADIAFIALHGRFGEDGTIQAMLEEAAIPYTGSGPEASRLAMDKLASRKIFQDNGMLVPEYIALKKDKDSDTFFKLNSFYTEREINGFPYFFPMVVKPNKEGSSIGISILKSVADFKDALEAAFSYDDDIIIEKFIDGYDITVGILDDKPLPVVCIKPKNELYDFEAKYTQGATEYIVPAKLENGILAMAQDLGLKAHNLLGCSCFSRVDMRLGKENKIYLLEVNTIPGLTSTSLLPKAAKAVGIDFTQMCLTMIKSARAAVRNG
ncbi:MAG: D-alanine--D-alanine ligase [Candidatus Omnitrophota bacterium]